MCRVAYLVARSGRGSPENAPRLTREKFNSAIRTDVNVSLVITSCYSGGWTLKSLVGSPLWPAKKLNISGMTAVSYKEMSRAWASSQSCGRAGGSIPLQSSTHLSTCQSRAVLIPLMRRLMKTS